MLERETQPPDRSKRCCILGCEVYEPGVGEQTCVIWFGKRLCYANHFPAWVSFQETLKAEVPTMDDWNRFQRLLGKEAA